MENIDFSRYPAGLSEEFIRKNLQYLEVIRNFCLMDDDFMSKVFEDHECAQLLLNIILDRDDLKVKEVHGQHVIKNLQGRSVRLDILAVDEKGTCYNVEIQRSDEGADARRARYNSSLMDANLTSAGDKYSALAETYVIFITERDILKEGLPIYHIDRVIRETGEPFEDGSHIIYVNGQARSDTPLGWLMHDFSCTEVKDMHYSTLAERASYFKESKEGTFNMCRSVEKLVAQASDASLAKGIAEGEIRKQVDNLKSIMETLKVSVDKAMDIIKVPESERETYRKLLAQ